MLRKCTLVLVLVCALSLSAAKAGDPSGEAETQASTGSRSAPRAPQASISARTLSVAIEVDRDLARIVGFTAKDRPFAQPQDASPSLAGTGRRKVPLEVTLVGAGGRRFTRAFEFGPICFLHSGDAQPHVQGDTIAVHRSSFVVELPELAGFDTVEVARYEGEQASTARTVLGVEKLTPERYESAGGPFRYQDLAFAPSTAQTTEAPFATSGAVTWPEALGDPDIVAVYGNAAESDRRITIAIVPDGYRYADKATMKAHADAVVNFFRAKTPSKEYDPFINYVLVYAYSAESGPDQCDCAIIKDTAFSSHFPLSTPSCGHSDNRCLYYGSYGACDTDSTGNVALAEMRVPGFDYGQGDRTLVMVNTTRYGGCGGDRAVYSAGNASATEIAIHELGHSFANLADEYEAYSTCGGFAGEINTSRDAVNGAWPEWTPEIGAPTQGAEYYSQCLFRPLPNCDMRSLNQPFCPVCNQQWSLQFLGNSQVAPTAPVSDAAPASPLSAQVGASVPFSVSTRLPGGPGVTNTITWQMQGPEYPVPTTVAAGTAAYTHAFANEGTYLLTCTVVAGTNFIKPVKYGPNVDTVEWTIDVVLAPPIEVSPAGSALPLVFTSPADLSWEPAAASGSTSFNLYRGDLASLPGGSYGACLQSGLTASGTSDADTPPPDEGRFYLVSGRTSGGEGPLGQDSAGQSRVPALTCP